MKKRQTKHGVAQVRWLIGLAESDVARRQDRLPLKRGGVAFGSVTVDDLVQALEQGQSGEGADGSAKHAAVREAYLARVEAIVALTDEDRDPEDFVTEIDEMFFAWRVDAKGRTAKLMVEAALAVSRARRTVKAAGHEIEAAYDGSAARARDWDSFVEEEPCVVSLEDAQVEVDRAAHEAWLSGGMGDVA
jgi:ElaB/YqjD/DUF883 family membrane-anchored ribosome-binding protein